MKNSEYIKQLLDGGKWARVLIARPDNVGYFERTIITYRDNIELDLVFVCLHNPDIEFSQLDLEDITKITPISHKPTPYQVGTKVEILEVARECGDYDNWLVTHREMIGKEGVIKEVEDTLSGVSYFIKFEIPPYIYWFPHYAVAPVREEEIIDPKEFFMADKLGKFINDLDTPTPPPQGEEEVFNGLVTPLAPKDTILGVKECNFKVTPQGESLVGEILESISRNYKTEETKTSIRHYGEPKYKFKITAHNGDSIEATKL